jgi:ABC-2 type transport system ATP-binding protein
MMGLRTGYEQVEAVRGRDLRVPVGSICGFLGRNGAGKTTTIKMLLGMTRPTSGQGRVFGLAIDDPASSVAIRGRTGFVSEDKYLYDCMTAGDLIRFTARFFPHWRADLEQRYVRMFELPLDRAIKTLSRGTRTRLALLLALCRRAELLLLDEPTSGLDPAMTEDVRGTVSHAAAETTEFFSSHQIAGTIRSRTTSPYRRRRTVVAGAIDDLRERYRRVQFVFDGDAPDASGIFTKAAGAQRVRRAGRVMTVLASAGADPIVEQARVLHPVSVEIAPVTLKEICLEIVEPDVHGG